MGSEPAALPKTQPGEQPEPRGWFWGRGTGGALSHLFNHISASVAPVLGQAEPCSSFSTCRMSCSVWNLAGSES